VSIPKDALPTKAQRELVLANIAGTVPGTSVLGEIGATVGKSILRRAGNAIVRGGVRRFFRSIKGKITAKPGVGKVATARRVLAGGSKVTSGPLNLGKGTPAFRAGGTSFNIRTAAKAGGAVAAVGAGSAFALGHAGRPSAAVSVASTRVSPVGASHPAPVASARSAPSPSPGTSSGSPKRCCPPGSRMLCFKRKHNPEAEAKRRARRKAARTKSKAKTAKRTAKAKAAVARRKAARTARKVRKATSRVLRGRKR